MVFELINDIEIEEVESAVREEMEGLGHGKMLKQSRKLRKIRQVLPTFSEFLKVQVKTACKIHQYAKFQED